MVDEKLKAAIEERNQVIKNLNFIASALEQDDLTNFAKNSWRCGNKLW